MYFFSEDAEQDFVYTFIYKLINMFLNKYLIFNIKNNQLIKKLKHFYKHKK